MLFTCKTENLPHHTHFWVTCSTKERRLKNIVEGTTSCLTYNLKRERSPTNKQKDTIMLSSKTTNLACEVWAISWAPATIVTSVLENTPIVFLTTSRELRINKTTWPVVSGLLYLSAAVNSSIMFNCHSTNNEMVTNNYINNDNNI